MPHEVRDDETVAHVRGRSITQGVSSLACRAEQRRAEQRAAVDRSRAAILADGHQAQFAQDGSVLCLLCQVDDTAAASVIYGAASAG